MALNPVLVEDASRKGELGHGGLCCLGWAWALSVFFVPPSHPISRGQIRSLTEYMQSVGFRRHLEESVTPGDELAKLQAQGEACEASNPPSGTEIREGVRR